MGPVKRQCVSGAKAELLGTRQCVCVEYLVLLECQTRS
jgi:hypothetical protein